MAELLSGIAISAVLFLYPLWRIFEKAGLKPAWSLLVLMPLGELVVPLILFFADWPNAARKTRV